MLTHIMLDIETLGTKPGAIITAIGAVKFDPFADELAQRFYQTIDAADCQRHGLTIDASTVMWWLKQSNEARDALSDGAIDLVTALNGFASWFAADLGGGSPDEISVWGNGAAFDNALLTHAYEKIGCPAPWGYRQDRCYRTLAKLYPDVEKPDNPHPHNALADAETQALHLQRIYRRLVVAA